MSGHSKWATTKHKKAAIDAKRSSLFSKLSRNITVAAKLGGDPNPDNNATLAAAVARARMVSMPNAKIKAAIDKAFGSGADAANYAEITYEGYGPAGVAVYVDCLTDNKNRTAADVRSAFSHSGGSLGTSGSVAFQFERKGSIAVEKVIKSAENGNTIVSTIDVNIQRIVEKYIDEWMSGIGSKTAAVIAMDPRNGEILAMSSNRRFDLNNPRDLSSAYSQEEITAMTDEGRMDAWNQMWRNYCVNDTYEPGSPAKPMTVAAGLEEGVIGQNDTFLCDGGQDVGGYRTTCVSIYGHGILTVEQSLM